MGVHGLVLCQDSELIMLVLIERPPSDLASAETPHCCADAVRHGGVEEGPHAQSAQQDASPQVLGRRSFRNHTEVSMEAAMARQVSATSPKLPCPLALVTSSGDSDWRNFCPTC